jgi:hypothetical protein
MARDTMFVEDRPDVLIKVDSAFNAIVPDRRRHADDQTESQEQQRVSIHGVIDIGLNVIQ